VPRSFLLCLKIKPLIPPPFLTPPKLPFDKVMSDYPGNDVATLRELAVALEHDAIFG